MILIIHKQVYRTSTKVLTTRDKNYFSMIILDWYTVLVCVDVSPQDDVFLLDFCLS